MAIPKIKIYRLDQNYNPVNDTDIQMVSDDEIYPIVEKDLSLSNKEMLVGVTYRDLMAGKSLPGFESISLMEDASASQPKKTIPVCCDGWRLGNLKVYISTSSIDASSITWTSVVPEKYYRINFSYQDRKDNEETPTSKRRYTYLQIEFGSWIYSGKNSEIDYVPMNGAITRVRIAYSLFSDDLTSYTNPPEVLSLQRGKIYDGTFYGRKAISSSGSTSLASDSDGLPLKVEGNIGYKIKTYPCRQRVAQLGTVASSVWNKDEDITPTGKIVISDCSSWILSQTDNRRPRLFQKIEVSAAQGNETTSYEDYLELVQGVQYSSTLTNDPSGKLQLVFQLSLDYYNVGLNQYVFPQELFIRYNEEDDLLEDIFLPNYLDLTMDGAFPGNYYTKNGGTDTGSLILANNRNFSSLYAYKRRFKLGVTTGNGYDSNNTEFVALSWNGSTFTLSLPPGAYDGVNDTIRLYEDGELIYDKGAIKNSKYGSSTINASSIGMTLTDANATKPGSIALSYDEIHTFGNSAFQLTTDTTFQSGKTYYIKSGFSYTEAAVTAGDAVTASTYYEKSSENPWAVGWRICAWEKTKTAKIFVSSFRNWVSDHLNNSPDIFEGYAEYDGSETNPIGINFISSGFSIFHNDGAVSFSADVDQKDYDDIRNWPPSSLTIDYGSISAAELKLYTNMVYAKFAYLDGIHDVTNGLFRRVAYAPNINVYKLLEDPTYNTENSPNYANDGSIGDGNAVEKTTLTNKKWLIRNDSKMSTIFHTENEYLPLPSYAEDRQASVWIENKVQEGMYLQIQLTQYRSLQIVSGIVEPAFQGNNEQIVTKYANISWVLGYFGDTELIDTPEDNSIIFPVRQNFTYDASVGVWVPGEPKIQVYTITGDSTFQNGKDYYTLSGYAYSKATVVSGQSISGTYYELREMDFSTRTIQNPLQTLDYILSNREKIKYTTHSMSPYDIEFRMGDNGLIVSAKLK